MLLVGDKLLGRLLVAGGHGGHGLLQQLEHGPRPLGQHFESVGGRVGRQADEVFPKLGGADLKGEQHVGERDALTRPPPAESGQRRLQAFGCSLAAHLRQPDEHHCLGPGADVGDDLRRGRRVGRDVGGIRGHH